MQQPQRVQPYDVPSSAQLTRRDPTSRASEQSHEAAPLVNVHSKERLASLALGGVSLAFAAARRSPYRKLIAALGSALVYRGATGHCHVYQALGVSTRRD